MPRPGPQPRRSKYQPIADFLAAHDEDTVRLTFAQIEALIGFPLPDSAYVASSWWRWPDLASVRAWTTAGWQARLRVREKAVVFTRIDAAPE